jgi:hypothetical protein
MAISLLLVLLILSGLRKPFLWLLLTTRNGLARRNSITTTTTTMTPRSLCHHVCWNLHHNADADMNSRTQSTIYQITMQQEMARP